YEFDQSSYVRNALLSVVKEGLLGALLTGLMVLLFLRDWRSALIVVATIPFSLLSSVVALWGAGQTINIMTLGGLALAVGILVDEATVEIENINATLSQAESKARAVLDATRRTVAPRFLSMLCMLAVFVPSFLMTGVTKSLFVPLSLAVGFAMMASYFLSSSLVPVLAIWVLRDRPHHEEGERDSKFDRVRQRYADRMRRVLRVRWPVLGLYAAVKAAIIFLLGPRLGREIFPRADAGQFQLG